MIVASNASQQLSCFGFHIADYRDYATIVLRNSTRGIFLDSKTFNKK